MKIFMMFLFVSMNVLMMSLRTISAAPSSSSTCPMDLNYVLRIQRNSSACQNFKSLSSKETSTCCATVLSLFGIGFAQHLRETSQFNLQDLQTSISCMQDLQSKLNSLSLYNNLVNSCFDPLQFVISPNICAGIETVQDWNEKVGHNSPLNTACKPDLTNISQCDACVAAGLEVKEKLVSISGNSSQSLSCFYFAILYATGIVNEFGPESNGGVTCAFSLPVSQVGSGSVNIILRKHIIFRTGDVEFELDCSYF